MEILSSYSFQIVALGTVLLSIASAIVGSLNVYRGQSLIGDSIGHSTYPGIILAFMIFSRKDTVILLIGAMIVGAIAYRLIQKSTEYSNIGLDANMAIIMSGFFGLGLVLKSYIQGNPDYEGASQAGLDGYIFGQAAYIMESDVILIGIVCLICIALFLLFYKELKVYIFDREFAQVSGLPMKLMDFVMVFMTILVIGVGIKAVGAVLISSFLIIPTIAANQWTNRYSRVVILSCIFASISAFLGSYISSIEVGISTGPCIILISGIIAGISFVFGSNGLRGQRAKRRGIA